MSALAVRTAPLELLLTIEGQHPFPVQVDGERDIGLLKTLVAAGLVTAQIPPPIWSAGKPLQPAATVTAITSAGLDWMRKELRFQRSRRRTATIQARFQA